MKPALTHEQCRQEMCAACGGRAGSRPVSPGLGIMLRKWAQPTWNSEVTGYPAGICEYCRRLLFLCEKEGSTDLRGRPGATQRWEHFHMEDISVPRGQLAATCTCPICQARKSSSRTHNGSLKNVKTVKTVQIVTNKEEATEKIVTSNTMCTQCFQARTGVGIAHSCTSATRKKNMAEMVSKEEGSEAIVAKVLKDTVVEGQDSIRLKQLKGGKSLTVTLGQKK